MKKAGEDDEEEEKKEKNPEDENNRSCTNQLAKSSIIIDESCILNDDNNNNFNNFNKKEELKSNKNNLTQYNINNNTSSNKHVHLNNLNLKQLTSPSSTTTTTAQSSSSKSPQLIVNDKHSRECEFNSNNCYSKMNIQLNDEDKDDYYDGDFIDEDFQLNISSADSDENLENSSNHHNYNLNEDNKENNKEIESKDEKNEADGLSSLINNEEYLNENKLFIEEIDDLNPFESVDDDNDENNDEEIEDIDENMLNDDVIKENNELNNLFINKQTKENEICVKQCENSLRFESVSSIEDNLLNNQTNLVNNLAPIEEARIWSDIEAFLNQIPQTTSSSCGAIAIINVLKALSYQFDYDQIYSKIKFNKRNENASLTQYLFSRSIAGMNAQELIENMNLLTNNQIFGRFFSFYPPRDLNLNTWLATWINKGAIPVALLNLQRVSIWGFIPDAWHHQMIYGCGKDGILLTNPIERKTCELIMKELTSDSVLLIRSLDIIKRFNVNNNFDLIDLIKHKDKRWMNMNVLGQVVHVLRECKSNLELNNQQQNTNDSTSSNSFSLILNSTNRNTTNNNANSITHIEIPASYKPGITLFVYKDSAVYKELLNATELPVK